MKYTVRGVMTVSCWTEVEADSPEAALEIAEQREVGGLSISAIYPDEDECFHFDSDGVPFDLSVEKP